MPFADGHVVNKDGIPVRDVQEAISIEREHDPRIINLVPDQKTGVYTLPPQESESKGCLTLIPIIGRFIHKEK